MFPLYIGLESALERVLSLRYLTNAVFLMPRPHPHSRAPPSQEGLTGLGKRLFFKLFATSFVFAVGSALLVDRISCHEVAVMSQRD